MVAFWAVSSVVVPRAASDVARLTTALPTNIALQKAIASDLESGLDGKTPDQVINERKEATLRLYKVDAVEKLPINFQGMVFDLQEKMGNAVFDKHFGELNAAMDAQQGTFEAFSTLSPRLAVQLASMQLSGTSLASHQDYSRQAESHRRALIDTMNKAMTFNSSGANPTYRAGPELWAQVPTFAYTPPSFGQILSSLAPQLVVILLWLAGAIGAAVIAARRLKVMVA
ncbi:MAG: DUF3526 domain-containing protein [Alphaproteobacteria bacterium]|nr:DUF3526 domain-containing protein [Alphaproteobacteria bacterium]